MVKVPQLTDNVCNFNYSISRGEKDQETINCLKILSKTKVKFFPLHPHLTLGDETQ